MAETVVWNKKLLIVAVALALAAVVVFIIYDQLQQAQMTGDRAKVFVWKRDLRSGEEVTASDYALQEIPRSVLADLKGVVPPADEQLLRGNARVNRAVRGSDFVRYSDLLGTRGGGPSTQIKLGMRLFTISVDPNRTPGNGLGPDDRIDLIGLVSVKGKPPKAYLLIENLRVLAIGGRAARSSEATVTGAEARKYDPGMQVYRSVSVEVYPDTAVRLADLLPRILGNVWLVVRNPTDTTIRYPRAKSSETEHGAINPEVLPVLDERLPEDVQRG